MDSHDGVEGCFEVPVEARVEQLLLGQKSFQAVSLLRGLHGLNVSMERDRLTRLLLKQRCGSIFIEYESGSWLFDPNPDPSFYYNYKIIS